MLNLLYLSNKLCKVIVSTIIWLPFLPSSCASIKFVIPDNKLDEKSNEYLINLLQKKNITINYYPSQFIIDIFTKCKIPESL